VLDSSVRSQSYVEDCEVCCHPIEVRYTVEDDAVRAFEARALGWTTFNAGLPTSPARLEPPSPVGKQEKP